MFPIPLKNLIAPVLFFTALIWFYNYLGFFETMQMRPSSIHMWAQCERASIALNYAETDMNFFLPRIHKFNQGDGITGMEFPLVNYVPAICYKLFGFNEIYFRGFVLLTIVLGLYLFYKLLLMVTDNNYFLSLGLTGAGYFSPVLIYYSNSFMPDITSLGFALAAWYFFFKFVKKGGRKTFYFFWTFAVLAALVKITSLLVILVVMCVLVLDQLKFFNNQEKGFLFERRVRWKIFLAGIAGIIVVASWYLYARWLSSHYSEGFALVAVPVDNLENFHIVWNEIKRSHRYEYYSYEGYILFMSIIALLGVGFKFVNRLYFIVTLLTVLGSMCFVYLMFWQFKDHDYYIITISTSVFLLCLTFADFLTRIAFRFSKVIPFVFIVILFFNTKESIVACKKDFSKRYDPKYVSWLGDFLPYHDLEPKLRRLGISRTDYTLSGFDWSFCNSLYLMDQLGENFDDYTSEEKIKQMLNDPRYKYLVVNDSAKLNKKIPGNDFSQKIVTTHRGLLIYKLR